MLIFLIAEEANDKYISCTQYLCMFTKFHENCSCAIECTKRRQLSTVEGKHLLEKALVTEDCA